MGYKQIVEGHHLANRLQCYSYLIEAGKSRILYSADLGSEKDLLPHLEGVDLVVVESTHIDVSAMIQAVIEKGVGRLILTHVTEDYKIDETMALATKAGADNINMAEDGMRLDLL